MDLFSNTAVGTHVQGVTAIVTTGGPPPTIVQAPPPQPMGTTPYVQATAPPTGTVEAVPYESPEQPQVYS